MIKVNGHIIKPTIFPDHTSQVWKLPIPGSILNSVAVVWFFEEERELMDIASIATLFSGSSKVLYMPFLPYGRQDKEVGQDTTFNLTPFAKIINCLQFESVTTFDAHNTHKSKCLIKRFNSAEAFGFHGAVLWQYKPHVLIYPDEGAYKRYHKPLNLDCLVARKVRDQATGEILSYEIENLPKAASRILIIDDICDGGATFIRLAKAIKEVNPKHEIGLAVSHGLFTKGTEVLAEAGIGKIFTTNSLLKNSEGYPVV